MIEGSTQGGKFIARHLSEILGVEENSGASFFDHYRWEYSWTAFRRWFGRDLERVYQDDIEGVIEGANIEDYLGIAVKESLSVSPQELLGKAAHRRVREGLADRDQLPPGLLASRKLEGETRRFHLTA